MNLDLHAINHQLRGLPPEQIVQWAMGLGKRIIASTSFSKGSAAMLNILEQAGADFPVVWVDSGYNTPDAYRVAQRLIDRYSLHFQIYTPRVSVERRAALGGVPAADSAAFKTFVEEVKLEPFQRALNELQPDIWITGIRRDETAHRQGLDIVSWDERGLLKVAPIFEWSQAELDAYLTALDLPSPASYFDPTKLSEHAECGLHTSARIAV
ncbi:MAG TPA: phosphoadenosine phosphosulfate reductase family protein [Pseudomonadales bacterium]|nr:phosphoadenosine phosphosulfate reductase family protein [Pseudomonadales bacterium]